jgi:gamma-glutamylcyclotransferase (GGCT)/AIG2-like uncharacterized protein YtfP
VFVYGTLMRGYALHLLLARASKFLGEGRVHGRLLDLGRYPGLVDGAGSVHGEIYRLDDPELLAVLDHAEGYNFGRRRTTVTLASGRRARARGSTGTADVRRKPSSSRTATTGGRTRAPPLAEPGW